ncbi:hydrogenase maturation protease [Thioalkalivibrio sp. ALMg11]|uniref:hydrogenase maturation protease n=1 Tax=Thioalkalivibrio sp. ALMg11 TaxID=1158165 RepID=UPI0003AAF071|nr:hydrogenase maturation protease [Thioalkalivibrio sp. ALMg11]
MGKPEPSPEDQELLEAYQAGAFESDLDAKRRTAIATSAEKASRKPPRTPKQHQGATESGREPKTNGKGPIVLGIGNPWRGDDGIGHAVVEALRDTPGLTTATCSGEPAELMDLWQDHDPVILVDAIVTGAAPGTLHRLDAREPLPRGARYSSHGIGLAEAVELARALDALPPTLIVHGIEPAHLEDGTGLSLQAIDAIPRAARRILDDLTLAISPDRCAR